MNRVRAAAALAAVAAGALPTPRALPTPPPATRPAQVGPDGPLVLPAPVGAIPVIRTPGAPVDAHKPTYVPPPGVTDRERVEVVVDPLGRATRVSVVQGIEIVGAGDYVIREPGPAQAADPVGDSLPPVLKSGEVTWQGFSPGHRVLEATIGLVAESEAPRLPMTVELRWTPAPGGQALRASGRVPGAGTLGVTLTNQTALPTSVPTGDVAAADLVAPLTTLLRAAGRRGSAQPPAAGRGLPLRLPARGLGARSVAAVAPLRVTGTVRVIGASGVRVTPSGPAVAATADGARVDGTLSGRPAHFDLAVPAAGQLAVELHVVPGLDVRSLRPRDGSASWSAWAARRPDAAARRVAVDQLVDAATAAARDDAVAPYLGHVGPGPADTTFRYVFTRPPPRRGVVAGLRRHPGAIALAGLALAAIAGNAVAIWRRL